MNRKIVRSCLAVVFSCLFFSLAIAFGLHISIDSALPGIDSAGIKFLASWYVIYLAYRFWVIWSDGSKHSGNRSNQR